MTNHYNKSIIYKLFDKETHETYYGSTAEPVNRRISKHRCRKSCKCSDIITRNDFEVVVLEEYDTDSISKTFLLERERHYIVNFDCLNVCVPLQTRSEYYQKNKTKILRQQRWWKKRNKCKPLLNTFIIKHLNKINPEPEPESKSKEIFIKPISFFDLVKINYNKNNI